MSRMFKIVAFVLTGGCLMSSAAPVPEGQLARGSHEFWDRAALYRAPRTFAVTEPCSNVQGRVVGVEPIWIEGEPLRGKPTRVFAWWGLPPGASAQRKVPAMVLVHGGGGTAFATWVKRWNDRGFAAIAMDTCGKIPQGERDGKPHPVHAWSGPAGWGASVAQIGEPIRDQWTYHAVAAVLRSHSFLRARPEVQADRIGLTGISWGGYLTSIVMSVDDRFRFAAPVYGCGYYDLNPEWCHMHPDKEKVRAWFALWDPKNYIQGIGAGGVKCPVLWCDGTNDRWYPLDALRKSCALVPSTTPLALSLKLRMPHGHPPSGDPPEITAFAEHYLKGAPAPLAVTSAHLREGRLRVAYDAPGSQPVRAELLYTCATNALLRDRAWQVTPVKDFDPARGTFAADVPANAVMFFANVITRDRLVFSTRVFERADFGLVANPRNPAADWMAGKTGVFAHYLYSGAKAHAQAAERFDVKGLVAQLVDMKADWFCLTLGQNSGWYCAPNATLERLAGYKPGARCLARDIPAEIIAALKPHGIRFMLYLPCQTANADAQAAAAFGFPPNPNGRGDRRINAAAADRWAAVIEEWSRRYGAGVAGWWFDGAYRWIRFDDDIASRYAAACKRGNPNAVVAFNEGVVSPLRRWTEAGDYLAGEINKPFEEAPTCENRFTGDRPWQVLTFCGATWGRPDLRYTDEQWIAWMRPVLAAGGAVTMDMHIDRPTGLFEPAQVAQMKRVFAAARTPAPTVSKQP